jgi:signal transduction histidine kinase/ligand-binding sensor domain-containing protein
VPPSAPGRPPRRLLLLPLFALISLLRGAEPPSDWSTRVWKTVDGLAGNNVTDVTEGADGFLWLVAGGRLVRFDGVELQDYPPAGLNADQAQRLRAVHRLRNGDLFLTAESLVLRASGGRVSLHADELLPDITRADTVGEDETGAVLFGYQNGAVYQLRDGRLSALGEEQGLPAGRTRCVFAADARGNLWFAKAGTVGIFREGRFQALLELGESAVRLAPAKGGGVWICAHLQLLHYEEGGTPRAIGRIPARNREALPSAVLEDRAGAVWIGTTISGLFRYSAGEFRNVPISHREVVCLAEDREGSLWVGTSGGGLNQVQPRSFHIEGEEIGVPFRAVQALCEDPQNNLWAVAQDGTPVRREGGEWRNIFSPTDGFEGEATAIAADRTGAIWIGTRNHRLYRWQNGRLDSWGRAEGLLGAGNRMLLIGAQGDLWIAGSRVGSLQRFRHGRFEDFPVPPACDSIWALAEDAAGNLWAGGSAGTRAVLLRVDPAGVLTDESARAGSRPHIIRALHATPDGALWIGYNQGGLGHLQGGRFTHITSRVGLGDDNLRLIISDRHGSLWFAAVTTVFKVPQAELDAFVAGQRPRIQSEHYGRDQGLHIVLGGSVGALIEHTGRLWLPLATSLVVIDPEHPPVPRMPPPVVITRFIVDEQVVAAYGGPLPPAAGAPIGPGRFELAPGHRRIEINFTGLSFRAPKNIRYRYRLENFDDRWLEAGPQRSASYSRLPAGNYRFRVMASNGDGGWNETGATLALGVAPFLWETWWFRCAEILAATAVVFAFARFVAGRRVQARMRALEQQAALERERARIARDIHDDLGSRLTKIALLGGLADRERAEPEKVGRRLQEISDTARQLLTSLDETVWAVNPRNDNLPQLINYLGQFAAKFLATAEIRCVPELPDDPPAQPVSAEARHHLFLTVKEALTNVVKHAHAREVKFRCAVEAPWLRVVIADDGLGFAGSPEDPEADGLRNMRQRMAQLGGKFLIEGAPGAGTRITLQLPLAGAPARPAV